MRAFHFPLDRVLHWRETELSLEEAKAENLRGSLRAAEQARADLPRGRTAAQAAIGLAPMVRGRDLAELDRYHDWSLREERRLAVRMGELQQAIEAQLRVVTEARRRVRMIERLKVRRYESWKAEADREMENLAGESAISQWRRMNVAPAQES